jgi:hypothetical protein
MAQETPRGPPRPISAKQVHGPPRGRPDS